MHLRIAKKTCSIHRQKSLQAHPSCCSRETRQIHPFKVKSALRGTPLQDLSVHTKATVHDGGPRAHTYTHTHTIHVVGIDKNDKEVGWLLCAIVYACPAMDVVRHYIIWDLLQYLRVYVLPIPEYASNCMTRHAASSKGYELVRERDWGC
jgi:hypothetical protein